MIFIGDGDTDIPCFRLVKDQGGHSIAVYRQHAKKHGAKRAAERLKEDGRVNFLAPANYQDGTELDRLVKAINQKGKRRNRILAARENILNSLSLP